MMMAWQSTPHERRYKVRSLRFPRRHKLRIPRSGRTARTHSLRCSGSPHHASVAGDPKSENCVRSLCSAFPHATRFAGLARGPRIVLDKKRTGRTRKGYAASVSGKAANGCAVDGPKEKNAKRRTCTCVQVGLKRGSSECVPPSKEVSYRHTANLGQLKSPLPAGRGLEETSGRFRIPCLPLSAGATLAGDAGRRGRRPLQDGAPTSARFQPPSTARVASKRGQKDRPFVNHHEPVSVWQPRRKTRATE